MTFESTEVPDPAVEGNLQGPTITVSGLDGCTITDVKVEISASASDLGALGPNWEMRMDRIGGPIGWNLFEVGNTSLTGTQIGSSCGSLIFQNTGPAFPGTTSPPYDGPFQAFGDVTATSPEGFVDYIGTPANGEYGLYTVGTNQPLTIDCFRLTLSLSGAP